MAEASRPQVVKLRSGEVVRVRQVQPDDAPALARAYANLGEQSRYRRFFKVKVAEVKARFRPWRRSRASPTCSQAWSCCSPGRSTSVTRY